MTTSEKAFIMPVTGLVRPPREEPGSMTIKVCPDFRSMQRLAIGTAMTGRCAELSALVAAGSNSSRFNA